MSVDRNSLRTFLEAQYARTTARKYLGDILAYLDDPGVAKRPENTVARQREYVYAWRALEFYCERTGAPLPRVQPPTPPAKLQGGRRARGRHKALKTHFTRDEWVALWRELDPTRPTDVVLRLQMQTALRCADVLRVTHEQLVEADRTGVFTFAVKGGKESRMPIAIGKTDWFVARAAMKRVGSPNLAGWVSTNTDPSGAAYFSVRKRLIAVGEKLNLSTPYHTHRLRRSLATFLLEDGASATQVQQILDHEKLATTDNYVRGAYPTVRGQLLSEIHTKIIGGRS